MKQEILKRAKEMNIDFGDGQTLRGLLEDMEREIVVKDRIIVACVRKAFDDTRIPFNSSGCYLCDEENCGMTKQDCVEKTQQNWFAFFEAELAKEQNK